MLLTRKQELKDIMSHINQLRSQDTITTIDAMILDTLRETARYIMKSSLEIKSNQITLTKKAM